MSFRKSSTAILILLILSFSFSQQFSFAYYDQSAGNQATSAPASTKHDGKKRIIELMEERTANTKHYLLEDGSVQAVITLEPQHYQDQDGNWQNIAPVLIDEADIQETEDPVSEEVIDDVKQIRKKSNELKTRNELIDSDTPYRALQIPFDISLPKMFHQGYSVQRGGERLSFKPIGASNKAEAKMIDKQSLLYADVWTSTDVTLSLLGGGLKETLILKDNHAPKTFTFEVEGQVNMELSTDQLFILPAYLIDAAGKTEPVDQVLRKEGNKQYIDITVDDAGLTYPIEVDPTVAFSPSIIAYRIVYPFSTSGLYYGSSTVIVGGRAWNHGYISYLNFDLSSIDGNVSSASLTLNRINSNSGDNRPLLIESYMVSSPWSSVNSSQIPGRGAFISSLNTPANSYAPVVFTGMEKYVRNVVAGNPNYGIELFPLLTDEVNTTLRYLVSPTLTITYTPIPKISEVVSPVENQFFSSNDNSFIPIIKVSGPDATPLTAAYYLDNETSPRETRIVSNPQTAQTVSFNHMNIGALTEGRHTFRFSVSNGRETSQKSVNVYLDKTAPLLGSVSAVPTNRSISVSGSASDGGSGLEASPYRYTVGTVTSGWTSQTTYTAANLTPNSAYNVKFEARDKTGLVSSHEQQIYTTAQSPMLTVTRSLETGLDISINDSNPSGTKYVIQAGNRYVNETGALSVNPVWFSPANKKLTINGLAANTSYSLSIKARNEKGIETASSAAITGTTLAAPPATITPKAEQHSITLSWPSIIGATGFDVEADGTIIHNGVSVTYVHNNLAPNTLHMYRVRVINAGGTGGWSPLISVYSLPNPPTIPTGIFTTSSQTDIEVTWDIVAEAEGYDLEADGTVIEVGSEASYTLGGLQPLTDHMFRVRAKNSGGISDWSAPVKVKTLPYPPIAPTELKADVSIHNVTVSWSSVQGAGSYEIEVDGIILDNKVQTNFLHEGLEPISGHTYRVRGVNAGGKSPWSEALNITTHPQKPDIPTNVMTTAEETSISIMWYKLPHAESYDVEVDGTQIVNVSESQFMHEDLAPASLHTYRIRARNISGESEWTQPTIMATLPVVEYSSYSLTNIVAIVTNNLILISWDSVAPDVQYDVEVDGKIYDNKQDTIYHHTGLEANEFHTYKIRVKDESGMGDWVAVLALSTLPNPPDAPSNLEAFATYDAIELRWERVVGATEYELEIDGTSVDVGEVFAYTHEPLTSGSAYTYRLRAKNTTGVTAWSPAIVKHTTTPTYEIQTEKNRPFDLSLLAMNVQDFSELTFVVTYDPAQIEVKDLYNFTPLKDMDSGQIPGTSLNAIYEPGRIVVRSDQSILPGSSWSGELMTISFNSKVEGTVKIDVILK